MTIPVQYTNDSDHYEGHHEPFWVSLRELEADEGNLKVYTRMTVEGDYSHV